VSYSGPTAQHHVDRIGDFLIPTDTEAHRIDAIKCIDGTVGRYDPVQARKEGTWGERISQEYSYPRERIEPVRVFLDIGHNVGGTSVWAARVWWPDTLGAIFAYDPNPACGHFYDKNASLIQSGVTVYRHEQAISVDPRPVFHCDTRWGCSYTHAEGLDLEPRQLDGDPYEVAAIHPRDLPYANAIKCDAEGCEGDVLDHYTYWGDVHVLMLEWHTQVNRLKAFALADRVGLTLRKNDCGDAQQGVGCWVR
jgi:FkbM family methyltransferase